MTDKKKIENIYSKIEKISSKGKLYYNEYSELINQFIINGEYSDFEMTLYDKYNINTKGMNSVKMVKEKSWVEILFQSDSNISKKIKKLLDKYYVYQISDSFYYSYDIGLTYSSLTYYEISGSTCNVNFEIGNTDGVTKVYLDLIEPSDIKNINIYNYTHDTYSGDNNIEQSNIGRLIDSINLKSEYEWGFISSTPSVIFPGFMSFYGTQSDCRFNKGDVVKISNGNVKSDIISKIKYISGTQSIDVNLINKPYVILSGIISQYPTFNDNIYTNIPITQNGSYVIKIDNIYYFKLTVVKDLFLGKIIELEQYTIDSKYYINNKNIAKLEGRIETYLKVENYNYTKESPYDKVIIIGNRNKCTYKDLVDHYEWFVGDYETSSISDDSKLFYRYQRALKYLFE